jgi:soluble lytic murein transglycosylase-like protein
MYLVGSKAMAIRAACVVVCAGLLTPTAYGWTGESLSFATAPMCAFEMPLSVAVSSTADVAIRPGSDALCPGGAHEGLGVSRRVTREEARNAFQESLRLARHGRPLEALLHLRVVEAAYPHLGDRMALRRADLLMAAGQPESACVEYRRASEGLESNVRALADVGGVRCRIAAGTADAERALQSLLRAYPELPMAAQLRYELARAEERQGNPLKAARIYRNIDLSEPASSVAARARARLQVLAREGTRLPPLPSEALVERLERMMSGAPPARVKKAMAALGDVRLTADLEMRVAMVAARIAKVEGRYDDARNALNRARFKATLATDLDVTAVTSSAQDMANAVQAREQKAARQDIARLKGPRPYRVQPLHRLLKLLDIAVGPGLTDAADDILEALAQKKFPAQHKLDAAILAAGTASDARLATLLYSLVDDRRLGVVARYHYARTLERLGRWAEAEIHHLRVLDDDTSDLGYYRMWSEQRLRHVREALVGHCAPEDLRLASFMGDEPKDPLLIACTTDAPSPAAGPTRAAQGPATDTASAVMRTARPHALARHLLPVAREWEGAFPWFRRAVDLLHLGDRHAASDELHEAFLAWRQALGRSIRRAGLLAVYRGADLPRTPATWQELRQRRTLDFESRQTLADVAAALGDMGVATGFGGHERVRARPRPHAHLVSEAARRHGVDPNLLFAVMRVESVYQRRIVSYAGAIGLMQIMPRTGRLIASQMERADFTTDQLLDPAVNIEFAAWYLASLIERFDGRLPLAIASYNGGPHNVRRWMHNHADDMPLDAFLERIPFSQTHRYVRRVLTHYAAYRAQQGLPMPDLHVALPALDAPDPIGF